MNLKTIFFELTKQYSSDNKLQQNLWAEIEKNYSSKKRYYHNLSHLENLYIQLADIKANIKDWHCILFSLFYHDIVYNVLKQDNEEKSALFAQKRMNELNVDPIIIEKCVQQIHATKKHEYNIDSDSNFFTDADLSILGAPLNIYSIYAENVRKEYSIYPDLIYKPGRKKVLKHFLAMNSIFKTDYFKEKFENQAKSNLQHELSLL